MSGLRPPDTPLPPHPKREDANSGASTVGSDDANLTVEQARRIQIDARIAALEREIIELKVERNSISPIARLPPEILSRIFVALANVSPEPGMVQPLYGYGGLDSFAPVNDRERRRTVKWSVVTEVSRHWRDVGLACPQLWSHVAFHKANWAKVMLQRSKQAPLYINLLGTITSDTRSHATEALSQPHRLRSLKFGGDSDWARERIADMTSSAPILETLELKCYPYSMGTAENLALPENLFSGDVPKLRHLSLVGWRLPSWDSPLLSGLTTLQLQRSGTSSMPMPSATLFLDALNRMPNLKELDLDGVIPDMDPVMSSRVVPLASLEKLILKAPLKDITHLLKHTSVAPSATLNLFCHVTSSDNVSIYTNFGDALHSWLSVPVSSPTSSINPTTSPRSFKSLHLIFSTSDHLNMTCYFEKIDFASDFRKSQAPLSLQITGDGKRGTKELLKLTPFSGLRSLNLQHTLAETELAQLGRLPNVESVYLHELSAALFVDYINNDPVMRPAKSPKTHNRRKNLSYFRNLKYISFNEVEFDTECSSRGLELDDVLDMLIMRYELGGEIEKLRINMAINLDEYDVGRVKEVCSQVDWDQVVEYMSDDEDEDGYGFGPHYYYDDEDYLDDDDLYSWAGFGLY